MVCQFKYLDSTNQWVTFGRIVSPLKVGETIKAEVTTAYSVSLYFKGTTEVAKAALVPGTICKIDFGTKEFQFVIVDGGKIEAKPSQEFCYHNYTIQELIACTREIYVQTAFFSLNQYSPTQFFVRLFALSDSDRALELDTAGDFGVLENNWKGSEYQVASNSLLDNIIKIGLTHQVRFKARITATGSLQFFCQSLKGSATITSIDGEKLSSQRQYLGANYASKVIANVQNLSGDKFSWCPSPSPSHGQLVEPETDYMTTITQDNAVLKLPFKIRNAMTVRLLGFGYARTDSLTPQPPYSTADDYRVFTDDGTRIYPDAGHYVVIDTTQYAPFYALTEFPVVSEPEWRLLDPDSTGGHPQHQKNTLYYKQGENKIYNMGICQGGMSTQSNSLRSYYIEEWQGGAYVKTVTIYPFLKWHLNKNIVLVNLYTDTVLEVKNKNEAKRATFYSQEDNLISGTSLAHNLENYIESMQNDEEIPTYQFSTIDDVPQTGSKYSGKVIAAINYEIHYAKVIATLILSDDLVKKSEYLSADSGINLPDININKAFDRFTTYQTRMWFCKTLTEADYLIDQYGADTFYNLATYATKLLDSVQNDRTAAPSSIVEADIKMGDGTPIYSAGAVMFTNIGNMLLVTFKTLDNAIIGTWVDTTLGTDFDDLRFYPINFIEAPGTSESLELKLRAIKTSATNYPRISEANFNSTSGQVVAITDSEYKHDPAERVNIAYQLIGKTNWSEGYVSKAYFDECGLIKDCFFSTDKYTRRITLYSEAGAVLGTHDIINIVIANPYTGIYSVSVQTSLSAEAGTNGYAVINRVHNTTGLYEALIKTEVTVVMDGVKYIRYYVAFTK